MAKRPPTTGTETTPADNADQVSPALADDPVERVLRRAEQSANRPRATMTVFGDGSSSRVDWEEPTAGDLDLEERYALRRVGGLSTELEDVTEVEYRQLRLENVILVGVYPQGAGDDGENSMTELALLCETAGALVLDGLMQLRPNPDPATYIGRGKAEELANLVQELGADTVVADHELQPSQRRALEDVVKVKVIDRTAVILDIFSQHAKTREGKAQVELAQLKYLLPRLRGWGESMSRQAGGQVGGASAGMGSRGPGETKIELDRRRINTRIARLRKQIASFGPARLEKRRNRERSGVASVAVAGYTNAGKSSLMNRVTGAGVLVEDALFATLDATVRKATTPDGRPFTVTDTVGFVRQLPHQLVEAFRSTLEEVAYADLIVHVVDASHPDPALQIRTVRDVFRDIDATDIPELVVFNKVDLVDRERILELRGLEPAAVLFSAKTGQGEEDLLEAISQRLPRPTIDVTVTIPYDRGDLVALVHDHGEVTAISYDEDGTTLHALVDEKTLGQLQPYLAGAPHSA